MRKLPGALCNRPWKLQVPSSRHRELSQNFASLHHPKRRAIKTPKGETVHQTRKALTSLLQALAGTGALSAVARRSGIYHIGKDIPKKYENRSCSHGRAVGNSSRSLAAAMQKTDLLENVVLVEKVRKPQFAVVHLCRFRPGEP